MNTTIYLKTEDDDIVIVDGDMEIIRCDHKMAPWEVADAILAYFHYIGMIEYVGNGSEEAKAEIAILEQEKPVYNFQLDERLSLIENYLSKQVALIESNLKDTIRTEMVILENTLLKSLGKR